jgi:hypothetical protein
MMNLRYLSTDESGTLDGDWEIGSDSGHRLDHFPPPKSAMSLAPLLS